MPVRKSRTGIFVCSSAKTQCAASKAEVLLIGRTRSELAVRSLWTGGFFVSVRCANLMEITPAVCRGENQRHGCEDLMRFLLTCVLSTAYSYRGCIAAAPC